MSAKKLNTEIRKEQIVRAALNLVARHGLKAMTVSGIAHMVGLTPSAIYRHFKSKDEVLDATLDLIRDRLLINLKTVKEENIDSLNAIRRLLMLHINLILEFQAIPRILFSDEVYSGHPERKAKLYRIIKDYIDGVGYFFLSGQQKHEIREDIPHETLSVMFLGMFQPSAMLWYLTDGSFNMIKQSEKTWQVLSEALKSK